MPSYTFDALAYFEKLKAAGLPEAQAKIIANAMREMLEERNRELATKADLKDLELRLLKWQFGMAVALAAIMAKGFGWLGF